ncbi:hypothetical protein [Nocardia farcinica]|uniref:hypothetical protein n=1 Tax=Nocardia farcinica TaxID=37329 RepID=UPI001893075F|nr:hypothetical protein [Nocardia farcinica]MBF6189511.1 hypothetical protein [Nocardia farcinica]MBF6363187.1 hypothetical protein [Nocardia farcinica]
MTHDDVVTLLQVIHAYDGREITDGAVLAWEEAARRQQWTFEEAVNGVHAHYSENTKWIMPGHVTQMIRRERGRFWQE